jgi:hypothetical protein
MSAISRVPTLRVVSVVCASAVAGLLIRAAGTIEGLRATGGVAPIAVSAALFIALWLWTFRAWDTTTMRASAFACVTLLTCVSAGVVWTAYAAIPGAALAAVILVIVGAARR